MHNNKWKLRLNCMASIRRHYKRFTFKFFLKKDHLVMNIAYWAIDYEKNYPLHKFSWYVPMYNAKIQVNTSWPAKND